MPNSNDWLVAVFKCKSSEAAKNLVDFYRFIDSQKGVQSLHFSVDDRVEDEVVFTFRVLLEPKLKETLKTRSATKLGTLLSADKFAIDPTVNSNLKQYVSWFPEKKLAQLGVARFAVYVDLLKNMSVLVIDALEKNFFSSNERIDLAHVFTKMLGCTEYGLLRTSGIEVGYYDRIEDKYCSYLRQNFPQPDENKKETESTF